MCQLCDLVRLCAFETSSLKGTVPLLPSLRYLLGAAQRSETTEPGTLSGAVECPLKPYIFIVRRKRKRGVPMT